MARFPFLKSKTLLVLSSAMLFSSGFILAEAVKVSADEMLLIEQIAQAWMDENYEEAQGLIENFLTSYADSEAGDRLNAMLGDLRFSSEQYYEAAIAYKAIRSVHFQNKVLINHLQALYNIDRFSELDKLALGYLEGRTAQSSNKNPEFIPDEVDSVRFIYAMSLYQEMKTSPADALQMQFAEKAKQQFFAVMLTKYRNESLDCFAEVLLKLDDHQHAVGAFSMLAKLHPAQQEEYLLSAAHSASHFNKNLAIGIYKEVLQAGGKKKATAAFNVMLLAYETKDYQTLLSMAGLLQESLCASDQHLLSFYEGMAQFHLENFSLALPHLQDYLKKADNQTMSYLARMALISSLIQTKDIVTLANAVDEFERLYQDDAKLELVYVKAAQMEKNAGHFAAATKHYQKLLSKFPNTSYDLEAMLNIAAMQSEDNLHEASLALYHEVLRRELPSVEIQQIALQGTINAYERKLEQSSDPADLQAYIDFLEQKVLTSNVLTPKQKKNARFRSVSLSFAMKDWQSVIAKAHVFISTYANAQESAMMHKYICLSMDQLGNLEEMKDFNAPNFEEFQRELFAYVDSATNALEKIENEKVYWHIKLFNAHLSSHYLLPEAKKKQALDYAAYHLYQAIQQGATEFSEANLCWLAHYLYDKAIHNKTEENTLRALEIFCVLFDIDNCSESIGSSYLQPDLEPYLLQFADLLRQTNTIETSLALYNQLRTAQEQLPLAWQYKEATLFEFALTLELSGQLEFAALMYDEVIQKIPSEGSRLRNEALLQKSRLTAKMLKDQGLEKDSKELSAVLETLKSIQMHKLAKNEPIHLEAALDFIELQISLAEPASKTYQALHLLQTVKTDFTESSDIISKHYQQGLQDNPEALAVHTAYLGYIEAEIARLQYEMALHSEMKDAVEPVRSQAVCQLESLQDRPTLTPYLQEKIHSSLTALKTEL